MRAEMASEGELLFTSGEAATAYDTIVTAMVAKAPAPRPCLKILPVGYATQKDLPAYFFALTKAALSSAAFGGACE